MLGLVARLREIEIVRDVVILLGGEGDLHVEFTPSFFRDTERRVLEGCCALVPHHEPRFCAPLCMSRRKENVL